MTPARPGRHGARRSARVIAIARDWLGTPYRHQASTQRRRLRLPRPRARRLARAARRRADADPALHPRLGRSRRARSRSPRRRAAFLIEIAARRGRPRRADPVPHAPRRAGEALRHPDRDRARADLHPRLRARRRGDPSLFRTLGAPRPLRLPFPGLIHGIHPSQRRRRRAARPGRRRHRRRSSAR